MVLLEITNFYLHKSLPGTGIIKNAGIIRGRALYEEIQVNSPEIDSYFCHVSHKMTSLSCWLFIYLRQFTKIVCFYDVWIFAPWIWSCWENASKSLRAAKKSQGTAEKNKEKVEANCTGFSAALRFSFSRNVLFWIWNNLCKN